MTYRYLALAPVLLSAAHVAQAQEADIAQDEFDDNTPAVHEFSDEEIAAIAMPELAFEPDDGTRKDYHKYFYFHRADTDFSVAYRDIVECDALSSGASIYMGGSSPASQAMINQSVMQYGLAGGIGAGIGAAIGSAIADAIWGSDARRDQYRMNMRNCMFYKGYDRYGLSKDRWQEFHFMEGNGRKEEEERIAMMKMQARVASGETPTQERIEP